jgi:proteasome-associated ATPase
VTYAGGDKEVLYFKDFNSGAMIQNVVDRAKKNAIKDFLTTGQKGLRVEHLLSSCVEEFKENEDLPNTTNPDDWARISGKKGERIVYIRTLITHQDTSLIGLVVTEPRGCGCRCSIASRRGGAVVSGHHLDVRVRFDHLVKDH